MIRVENVETYGFESAIRGMRNAFIETLPYSELIVGGGVN